MVSPGMEWMLDTLDELPDEIAASIESDQFIDNVIAQIDIVQAYKTWVPKNFPNGHEGRDEIQVSCPTPSHRDNNPSASLNTENNVWTCYGCGAKGDVLGMIGYWKNLDPRDKREFMSLRKAICGDLGYEFYTTISGHEEILQTKPAPKAAVPDVPTHDAPDDLWDLDEAAAAGHFDKKKIEDLSQSHPELLNTLDELNAMGPKLADGTSKKSAIMDKLKAKTASDQPKGEEKPSDQLANSENQAPEQVSEPISTPIDPEKAPDQPIIEEKPAQKRKMPKFSGLDRAADAIFGPGAEKKAEKPTQEPEKGESETESGSEPPIDISGPVFDWRNEIPENTPLHDYLTLVSQDDSPEEYHISNFLQFIGLLLGKDVHLAMGRRIYGNCMTCIVGRTGAGKSSSEGYIDLLIERVMRFDPEDHTTKGVRVISSAGSGPWITSLFNHVIEEEKPNPNGKGMTKVKHVNPGVRAIVRWPEMSTMLARGDNAEKIKATLLQLYDVSPRIGGGSLTNGEYGADNPFGSIATTTQTKMLNKIVGVNDVHSGLLNRFWFIIGNRKPKQAFPTEIKLEALVPKVELIRKWAIEKADGGSWHGKHELVDLSVTTGSGRAVVDFLEKVVHPMMEKDNDMLQRADLTFKKLVLLFSANMTENVVSLSAVGQAKSYFAYLMKCYEIVSGQLLTTDLSEKEQLVVEALQKYSQSAKYEQTGRHATINYLWSNHLKRQIPEREQLVKIVKSLLAAGAIVQHKPSATDGRSKSETYSLPNFLPSA